MATPKGKSRKEKKKKANVTINSSSSAHVGLRVGWVIQLLIIAGWFYISRLTSVRKEAIEIKVKQELTLVLLSTAGDSCWQVKESWMMLNS